MKGEGLRREVGVKRHGAWVRGWVRVQRRSGTRVLIGDIRDL